MFPQWTQAAMFSLKSWENMTKRRKQENGWWEPKPNWVRFGVLHPPIYTYQISVWSEPLPVSAVDSYMKIVLIASIPYQQRKLWTAGRTFHCHNGTSGRGLIAAPDTAAKQGRVASHSSSFHLPFFLSFLYAYIITLPKSLITHVLDDPHYNLILNRTFFVLFVSSS